jgi:hypothetical protein
MSSIVLFRCILATAAVTTTKGSQSMHSHVLTSMMSSIILFRFILETMAPKGREVPEGRTMCAKTRQKQMVF